MTEDIREDILRIALLNAIKHGGKAQKKPVIGRLIAERKELKQRISTLMHIIDDIVNNVNKLSLDEQKKLIKEKWPEKIEKTEKKTEKKRKLPPLPNVEKYKTVVTRFAPNPNAPLHIGQARAIILSYEYAHMYKGKFILRLEDTDPRLKRSAIQFFRMIKEDLLWLGCKWDEEYIQSDRISIYYSYAERLLEEGKAYVCTCKPEAFRSIVSLKEKCPCRDLEPSDNLYRWDRMLDGTYNEGEAVLRIKTDLHHPNPAVRDWPAFRIIDTNKYPHPRVGDKYRVWPLYNFACGIDDHLMGITHIIRGKEHLTNQIRQEYLYRHLGWEYPEAIHYGRLKIKGAPLSKSKILQDIKKGIYKDWDDPRLATFVALRRRGITPEAIRLLMIEVGPRSADITLSWENLYAHNRRIIDPIAKRYFFVKNPVRLLIENVPDNFVAKIPFHPDRPTLGFRKLKIETTDGKAYVLISDSDLHLFKKGSLIRLIGLFNLRIDSAVNRDNVKGVFLSVRHEDAKRLGAHLIHWVPEKENFTCKVIMPDGLTVQGKVERNIQGEKKNSIVQFERFGFARVDKVDPPFILFYTHK